MLKLFFVYGHLLAVCVSLGSILLTDQKLWSWRRELLDAAKLAHLDEIQRVVTWGLVALWATGIGLIALGYASEGGHYLQNQKLWAKVLVVTALTFNGMLLHRLGFPLLQRGPLIELPLADRVRLGVLGAASGTSWLFAAFLGVARIWNHQLRCTTIMAVYAVCLGLAMVGAITLVTSLLSRKCSSVSE